MQKNKPSVKLIGTALAELFTVITIEKVIGSGQWERVFLAFGTLFLVLLPAGLEKLLHCKLSLPLYIFGLFYAIGPALGHCWNFYYTIHWWDRMLHVFGGVAFALVGASLFERMAEGNQKRITVALFGLIFSVAIAAVWEFVEFGADRFLGLDMQDDTVVTHICSYLLGEQTGVTGRIDGIQSVIVNGTALPVAGYIDIGLFDSMLDMLLESLGAILTAAIVWLDKGRHSLIRSDSKEKIV